MLLFDFQINYAISGKKMFFVIGQVFTPQLIKIKV